MAYVTTGSNGMGTGYFPLFVCGMHNAGMAERDGLANQALPHLAGHCERQRISLATCDVRTIAARRPHRDLVGACIDEIRHQQSWVVGVIAAQSDLPSTEAADTPQYPWQPRLDLGRLSAAELDVIESIAAHPSLGCRSFIYVHGHLRHGQGSVRVRQLLQGLGRAAAAVRLFHDPAELVRMVCDDISAAIEAAGRPVTDGVGPAVHEIALQAAFAESCRAAYVPIGDYARKVGSSLERGGAGGRRVVLVGQSGAGKSVFLAHWASEIRRERPDAVVIEYYVGASPHGAEETVVLSHVLAQLRDACSINDPLPADRDGMIAALRAWPAHAGEREVIVILDALDRLMESPGVAAWLAAPSWPANLILVASTQPHGAAYAEIAEPGWTILPTAPLTVDDRWRLMDSFLHGFADRLPEWVRMRLSEADEIVTPLFLRAVIEGLRIDGLFGGTSLAPRLLAATTIEALFDAVLEHLESDPEFGRELVRDVLCLLRLSHHGLSEDELADLVDEPSRSRTRRTARGKGRGAAARRLVARLGLFISAREGLLVLFHDSFAAAVEQRYMPGNEGTRTRHEELARYFAAGPSEPRRSREVAWQWSRAGRPDRLKECVIDIPTFMVLSAEEHRWDLVRYWQQIDTEKPADDFAARYLEALNRLIPPPVPEESMGILQRLGEAFLLAARHKDAVIVLERTLLYSGTDVLAIRARTLLSTAYHQKGDQERAESLLLELAGQRGIHREEQAALLQALERLANLYCARHAFTKAEDVLNRALPLSIELHGDDHIQTLSIYTLMGLVAMRDGRHFGAEHLLRPVLETCRRLYHGPHPEIASALGNLAAALERQGADRYPEAMELVREAVAVNERIYPEGHPETAYTLSNLGYMLRRTGRFVDAEMRYLRALQILIAVFDEDHLEVAHCRNSLGSMYTVMGPERFTEADDFLQKALDCYRRRLDRDNLRVISAELNLALLRLEQGQALEAVQAYAAILPRRISASGTGHPDTLRALENFRRAVAAARRAVPECRELLDAEYILAESEVQCGNLQEAVSLLEEMIPRLERTLGPFDRTTMRAVALREKLRMGLDP